MTDQCMHCECKGNLKRCLSTDCSHHETWYAKKQQAKIVELESKIKRLEKDLDDWQEDCGVQKLTIEISGGISCCRKHK